MKAIDIFRDQKKVIAPQNKNRTLLLKRNGEGEARVRKSLEMIKV